MLFYMYVGEIQYWTSWIVWKHIGELFFSETILDIPYITQNFNP